MVIRNISTLWLLCSMLTLAQTSTVVTFQQGASTTARAINNNGQIVGYFTPSTSVFPQAFTRAADGTTQTFLLPGALETRYHGINDLGEIVGTRDSNTRAFVRRADGTIVEITAPGTTPTPIAAYGINNSGYIVGAYRRPNDFGRLGFLRNLADQIVTLGENITPDVEAAAIANTTDRIILNRDPNGTSAEPYLYLNLPNGNFSPLYFVFPRRFLSSAHVIGQSINAKGLIVGKVGNRGFLARDTYDGVVFDLPNAVSTIPYGINDRNQIVGATIDAAGNQKGFFMEPCSPAADTTRAHSAGAESGVIDLHADGFCLWIVESDAPWITIDQTILSGSTSLPYRLSANYGEAREARITIGARQLRITQPAHRACLVPTPGDLPLPFPASGGTFSLNIFTYPGCPWTIDSSVPWIRFSATSGAGPTTLTLQVDPLAPESNTSRTATINIAGAITNLTQVPPPCSFSLNRTNLQIVPAGSVETIRVITGASCLWTPVPASPWATILSPSPSLSPIQGTSSFVLRLDANHGASPRSTSVTISSPSLSGPAPSLIVDQLGGAPCTYSMAGAFVAFSSSAATTSFAVQTGAGCPLMPVSNVPWVEILGNPAVANSVNAAIAYRIQANTSRAPRRGTITIGNLLFTIDQLGITTSQLGFVPVTPCRLYDSRSESVVGSQAIFYLNISGRCGVSSSARAFVLNVTAIPSAPLPFLSILPFGDTTPATSTLNSLDQRIVSNMAIVSARSEAISPIVVNIGGTTDLVVDVLGYFADPAPDSLVLYPITPCRVTDTRNINAPLLAGTSRDIPVAGTCGIPANAAAVSVNATAIPRGRLDYLTLYPAGRTRPNTSTLNAQTGQVTANAALLATGPGGAISVFATQDTDFALDVNGYFGPPSDTGLYFNTMPPCRLTDTRLAQSGPVIPAGSARTITPTTSACGIPANARAYAVNATAIPQGPMAFLSLFPAPTWTGVSTLNAFTGQITANFAIVPENGQGIGALASSPTHLALDISGFFATVPIDQRRPALGN